MIDAAKKISNVEEHLLTELKKKKEGAGLPCGSQLSLVLNKVDLVRPKRKLLPLTARLNEMVPFDKTFMVSAADNDGVDDIKRYLLQSSQPGDWAFPNDAVTDMPIQERICEVVREKMYGRMNQEIPYQALIRTESLSRTPKGLVRLEIAVFVPNERHQQMIVGAKGLTIQWITDRAKQDIEALLGSACIVKIRVRVRTSRQMQAMERDVAPDRVLE